MKSFLFIIFSTILAFSHATECPFSGELFSTTSYSTKKNTTISIFGETFDLTPTKKGLSSSTKRFLGLFLKNTKIEQDHFLGTKHLYPTQNHSEPLTCWELLTFKTHRPLYDYDITRFINKVLFDTVGHLNIDFFIDDQQQHLGAATLCKKDNAVATDTVFLSTSLHNLLYHVTHSRTPYVDTLIDGHITIETTFEQKEGQERVAAIIQHELKHHLQPPYSKKDCSWTDTAKNTTKSGASLAVAGIALSKFASLKSYKWGALLPLSLYSYYHYIQKTFAKNPVQNFKSQKHYEFDADEGISNDIRRLRAIIRYFKQSQIIMCYTGGSSPLFEFMVGFLLAENSYNKYLTREKLIMKDPIGTYNMIHGKDWSHPSQQERIDRFEARIAQLKADGHIEPESQPVIVRVFDTSSGEKALIKEYIL